MIAIKNQKNSIKINRFQMNSGEQSVTLEGMHSPQQTSLVNLQTRNLHLSELELLLLPYGLSLGGIATGELHLANQHSKLQLSTRMNIDSLVFNVSTSISMPAVIGSLLPAARHGVV